MSKSCRKHQSKIRSRRVYQKRVRGRILKFLLESKKLGRFFPHRLCFSHSSTGQSAPSIVPWRWICQRLRDACAFFFLSFSRRGVFLPRKRSSFSRVSLYAYYNAPEGRQVESLEPHESLFPKEFSLIFFSTRMNTQDCVKKSSARFLRIRLDGGHLKIRMRYCFLEKLPTPWLKFCFIEFNK